MSKPEILLTYSGLNFFTVILLPICPPMNTVAINEIITSGDAPKLFVISCPANPAAEFTKMNKAVVAAITLGTFHLVRCKTGDKKMPPPMPTKPDKNPIPPPMRALDNLGNLLRSRPGLLNNINNAAASKAIPKMMKNTFSLILYQPPKKAIGILHNTKGQTRFNFNRSFFLKTYTDPVTTTMLQINAIIRMSV